VTAHDTSNDTYTVHFCDGDMATNLRPESIMVYKPVELIVSVHLCVMCATSSAFFCARLRNNNFTALRLDLDHSYSCITDTYMDWAFE